MAARTVLRGGRVVGSGYSLLLLANLRLDTDADQALANVRRNHDVAKFM